ncbi:universal stress protein [Pontibacter harenae]|uniref:universal stress protein n=1 Tax=Pontibacter harenae TaxID=2894083 RepID=UPI001E40AA2D|nr:universal stress protein [Pontibacter harenae]MCC9166923.1 universal stress protein [Pontibacter harenae]
MKKILCPTDFSDTANKALEYAVLIAKQAGAHLTLLHVIHLPIVDTSEMALVAGELLNEQLQDSKERLVKLCQFIEAQHGANQQAGGFTCDYIVKEALLTDIVKDLTNLEGFDLIVMGTTGVNSTLEEILVGSNTEAVIEEVKCPVLSVPASAPTPQIKNIVYASDYMPEDRTALDEVVELGRLFGAPVNVVHVVKEQTQEGSAKAEQFWNELQQHFSGVPMRFQEVVSAHRADGLRRYYREANGSMLAMLRKDKGFFAELFSQSLAERMTHEAEVPLLVLHGKRP